MNVRVVKNVMNEKNVKNENNDMNEKNVKNDNNDRNVTNVKNDNNDRNVTNVKNVKNVNHAPLPLSKLKEAPPELSASASPCKEGGDLLSRIAVQYHRRARA